jgi:hypothetical protein
MFTAEATPFSVELAAGGYRFARFVALLFPVVFVPRPRFYCSAVALDL